MCMKTTTVDEMRYMKAFPPGSLALTGKAMVRESKCWHGSYEVVGNLLQINVHFIDRERGRRMTEARNLLLVTKVRETATPGATEPNTKLALANVLFSIYKTNLYRENPKGSNTVGEGS